MARSIAKQNSRPSGRKAVRAGGAAPSSHQKRTDWVNLKVAWPQPKHTRAFQLSKGAADGSVGTVPLYGSTRSG